MATQEIDIIKKRVTGLSKEEKIHLIEFLTKSLANGGQSPKALEFGKYKNSGRRMSTADDFKVAEWHESDLHLNGN
jgi:hypothetical protein